MLLEQIKLAQYRISFCKVEILRVATTDGISKLEQTAPERIAGETNALSKQCRGTMMMALQG